VRLAGPDDADGILHVFETVAAERRHILTEPPIDRGRRREQFLESVQS
jgi:hypothetical protein